MAEAKSKSGGSKLSRTQTVTVRLDPKLRYLAELAARKQRRTVSSYIEWAIERSLDAVPIVDSDEDDRHTQLSGVAEHLWDVEEADRFVALAINYPELLTHDEQLIWKLVRESAFLWRGELRDGEWAWDIDDKNFHFERLREHWLTFKKVADGDLEKIALPKWEKSSSYPKRRSSSKGQAVPASASPLLDDSDQDVPF